MVMCRIGVFFLLLDCVFLFVWWSTKSISPDGGQPESSELAASPQRLYDTPASLMKSLDDEINNRKDHNIGRYALQHAVPEDSANIPFQPFLRKQPKLIVLLAYQRSGSSFFGQIFNQNPDVFYLFEPVDSLYSSMYGTKQNRNVPSDITHYKDGTPRLLPSNEIEEVASFLSRLLQCNLSSLPTETLVNFYFHNSYNQFKFSEEYVTCMANHTNYEYQYCERYISRFCGRRFGYKPVQRQTICAKMLSDARNRKTLYTDLANETIVNLFLRHRRCMDRIRETNHMHCEHMLLESCVPRQIRATKVVRATMDSMSSLLETIPNFRVIHLVRDPRAVSLSRMKFYPFVRGIFSEEGNNTLVREALLYCQTVVRDIKSRLKLESRYGGKIVSLIYEEVVKDPLKSMRSVYEFIDEPINQVALEWMSNNLPGPSQQRSDWTDIISKEENLEILNKCNEYYTLTNKTHNRNSSWI